MCAQPLVYKCAEDSLFIVAFYDIRINGKARFKGILIKYLLTEGMDGGDVHETDLRKLPADLLFVFTGQFITPCSQGFGNPVPKLLGCGFGKGDDHKILRHAVVFIGEFIDDPGYQLVGLAGSRACFHKQVYIILFYDPSFFFFVNVICSCCSHHLAASSPHNPA